MKNGLSIDLREEEERRKARERRERKEERVGSGKRKKETR